MNAKPHQRLELGNLGVSRVAAVTVGVQDVWAICFQGEAGDLALLRVGERQQGVCPPALSGS